MKHKQVIQKEINIELIRDLINKGFGRNQILERLNWSSRKLTIFSYDHNIQIPKHNNIFPNEEQTQIILGSLLGDGCVSYSGKYSKNCRLQISHSMKQYDYLKYKYDILKSLCNTGISIRDRYDSRFKEPNYQTCEIKTKSLEVFTNYRKRWYDKKGQKHLNIVSSISNIEALGIAIWFMDDGTRDGVSFSLATQSFLIDSIQFLQAILYTKFNIETSIRKDKVLYIKRKSRETFINLIKPHIIDSMAYKICLHKTG